MCNAATYQAETMFHSTGGATTGGWNIWSNGFISTQHNFTAGPSRLVVTAKGTIARNVWPHMVVSVGGTVVGQVSVTSTGWQPYTFNFTATAGSKEIRIAFDNDLNAPPEDRNLLVDSVAVSCPPPAPIISVSLPVTSNWGTGYCVNVAVTNTGNAASITWSAVINTQQSTIYTSWNGTFSGSSGQVTVRPLSWNSIIQPGETITSIGFCANRNPGTNNVPTVVSVTGS
jgi:cellulase/cellobiase CelA1